MAYSSTACDQMCNRRTQPRGQRKRHMEAWDQGVDLDLADHRITSNTKLEACFMAEKRRNTLVRVAWGAGERAEAVEDASAFGHMSFN